MARREKSPKQSKSRASRVKGSISRTAKKVTLRSRPAKQQAPRVAQSPRLRRAESDVPMDVLNRTYTPTQTSLKTGFRATGEALQRDQEFVAGNSEERWKNEDHFTNKSGDPRIGTHRRKYEPGE